MGSKVILWCIGFLALIGLTVLLAAIVLTVRSSGGSQGSNSGYSALRATSPLATPEERYLDLTKRMLTRYGFDDHYEPFGPPKGVFKKSVFLVAAAFNSVMRSKGVQMVRYQPYDPAVREVGNDWPAEAETMVGLKRLDNIQFCVTDVIQRKVAGDLIECGAWRGGCCIFMRAILAAYGTKDRNVWVADSFEGLPKPQANSRDPEIWVEGSMAVSVEEVRNNFAKYGLLDEHVKFLKGFFKDSLPKAPIEKLAVLRVDGDLYESVTDTLQNLYPKVAVGGYVILDDYGNLPPATRAVDDYRKAHNITENIVRIDQSGAYWRRER